MTEYSPEGPARKKTNVNNCAKCHHEFKFRSVRRCPECRTVRVCEALIDIKRTDAQAAERAAKGAADLRAITDAVRPVFR